MRKRRLAALLAAIATAAGSVVLLTSGPASAGTVRIERTGSRPLCTVTAAGVSSADWSGDFNVTLDLPDTAVVNVPTAPSPYSATGSLRLNMAPGSPLHDVVAAAGATTIAAEYVVPLDHTQGSPSSVSFALSGTAPLGADTLSLNGSGELPPLTFVGIGERHTLTYWLTFDWTLTPLKADGTPTALGDLGVSCIPPPPGGFSWHTVQVLPAPAPVKHVVSATTGLAGGQTDLGQGSLTLNEGSTGTLALPDTGTASPTLFGFFPASAMVRLTPGPLTGTPTGLTAPLTVSVPDLAVLGLPLLKGKTSCTSKTTLTLTQAEGFTVANGGTLNGTYDLPAFTGCGPHNGLVSSLFSRPGNTLAVSTA
ncbi:hypothetical protein [Actinokineospora pegani]|uniref:hypothetical protein n=1 Tax=Actinokineospora pegani TaxID=2654637 RepID=UPI0012EA415C|nr:hypothetical protein [Actinokineospora pegani]